MPCVRLLSMILHQLTGAWRQVAGNVVISLSRIAYAICASIGRGRAVAEPLLIHEAVSARVAAGDVLPGRPGFPAGCVDLYEGTLTGVEPMNTTARMVAATVDRYLGYTKGQYL